MRGGVGEDTACLGPALGSGRGIDIADGRDGAFGIEVDADGGGAGQDGAAGIANLVDQPVGQLLRAAPDIMAASAHVTALGHGEDHPPERIGIVGIIGEVRAEREFQRLVIAEMALEHLAQRGADIAQRRPEIERQVGDMAGAPPEIVAGVEILGQMLGAADLPDQGMDGRAGLGEAGGQRLFDGVEPVWQAEGLIEPVPAHLLQDRDGNEGEVVV